MRIGLVCPYNMYKGGGVQECVRELETELVKRGHYVRIITPQPRTVPKNAPDDMIFIGSGADVKTPFHTTAQVSVSGSSDVVDKILADEAFDILHFHEPWISAVSRQILSRSNAKNIATFHAKLPETMMSRTIERVAMPYMKSILKYLDALTAVSGPAASYITTLSDEPITIIPNGIDIKSFSKRSTIKPAQILYIGRLEKRKGVKHLIDAFRILKINIPSATLVIAGDGPDRKKLEAEVNETKLRGVKFKGYVSDEEKKDLLATSSLFCSPAVFGESFGIVLLEAMAAGVPVVAGNNPGYTSVLQGRGQLSLVNPKESEDFANRMELFLTDNELRKLWLKWSHDYVRQFTYSSVVDSYESLYNEIL